MGCRGSSDQELKHKNIGCLNNKEPLDTMAVTCNLFTQIQNGHNALNLAEHLFRCGGEVLEQIENDRYFSVLNRSLLALVYLKKGQWDEALTIGENAFHDALLQGGAVASICEMVLGIILMEKGNSKEAGERLISSAASIIKMARQISLENSSLSTLKYINLLKLRKPENNYEEVSQKAGNSYFFRMQMFGPLRVFHHYEEIKINSWRTVKSRDLLAYLAHQDKPVSTDQILEDLWPDLNPDKASALFHTTLYYLRRLLQQFTNKEIIIHGSKRYQLRPGSILIDRHQFEEVAHRVLGKTMTTALANELETVAALYRGDYLEDLDYQWVIPSQEELRNININLKHELAVYYLKNKMYSQALVHLRQIMAKNPYSEDVLRLLLTTLVRMGDLLAAKKQYAVFVRTLFKELGIRPSFEIRAFYKELCAVKPAVMHA